MKNLETEMNKAIRPVVLVGTYRAAQMEKWILPKGYYNYPVNKEDDCSPEYCAAIKELWLYNGKTDRKIFEATFLRVATREELPEYPKTKEHPHSEKYLLFAVKELYSPVLDDATVHVRVSDFVKRTPKIVAAIKTFKDEEPSALLEYLPAELTSVEKTHLSIHEEALAFDLWGCPIVESVESEKLPAKKKTGKKRTMGMVLPYIANDAIEPFLNKIIQGDSAEVLKRLPENSVDLVVTSPPYDQIRDYNGFTLDLHAVGMQLFRVVKPGGVVAMVIQDSTKNFAKTLTSFRTIVDWCDNVGFKLFETVIYHKNGTEGAWWTHRFRVDHEYMPIFFKGERPAYFNKEPLKVPSKWGGKVMTGSGNRRTSGETTQTVTRPINLMKCRGTVWDYMMAGDKNPLKRKHPAVFPDKIPFDFIQCFCPPNGIVLDPFVGCGSTAVTAKGLGRNYIGIDISPEYCALAEERIKVDSGKYAQQTFLV